MIRKARRVAVARPAAVHPPSQTVYWLIALLLAIIATLLLLQAMDRPWLERAHGEPPSGWMGGDGVYAMPGQLARDQYGLYMLDTGSGTAWCYEYLPAKRQFQLAWARSYRNDRYLENWENVPDTNPEMIRDILRKQQRTQERLNGGLEPQEDAGAKTSGP